MHAPCAAMPRKEIVVMPSVRLSPSASVAPTPSGTLLRSDLGTFQLEGADVHVFLNEVVPWLNGTRDKEGVAAALPQYSRQSVLAILDLLERYGLLEVVPEEAASAFPPHWRGQQEFFRKWESETGDAAERLREARVLIVGLEPWGVI